MNSDNLPLIIMYTGPRGSGKTLVQTGDMCRRLIRSYLMKLAGMSYERIFSNYPAGFVYYPGHGLPSSYLKPEPLNMEALYIFDRELYQCRLYIDEIDQWLDRQEWMTTTQQILAKAVQLIRKRKMSITGTIQAFEWLNSKFQFQTDIVVKCRDAAFTPWGKGRRLQLGEVSFTDWKDKSGVMTGYSYDESQKIVSVTFQGKRFWNCYDTTFEFDPMETSTRYTLKRPQKEIIMPGAAGSDDNNSDAPRTPFIRDKNYHSERKNRIDVIVAQAVDDLRTQDKYLVKKGDMFEMVNSLAGSDVDHRDIGAALSRLGIKTYGSGLSKYNLTPSEEVHGVDIGTRSNKEEADGALDHLFDPSNHPGVKDLVGATR